VINCIAAVCERGDAGPGTAEGLGQRSARMVETPDYARANPGYDGLLKRFRGFRGRLPADFKFDRDAANGR
jgi:hypothetical protein